MSDQPTSHELVDVIDEENRVVCVVTRAEMRARVLPHRSVGVLVFDANTRLLVHRRSDSKDVWPSRWDLAAGGVLDAGESAEAGATRELGEELGLVDVALEVLGSGRYRDRSVDTYATWFSVVAPPTWEPTCPDGEVAETRWVTWLELSSLLAEYQWCADSLALALPLVAARMTRAPKPMSEP